VVKAEPANGLDGARASLRARQGGGARYDAANAPARELDWARRGSAYFARRLEELSDPALGGDSLVPGWTRQHVVACVAYHARALARILEQVRTGAPVRMYERPGQREEEIADGATLPPAAVRYLYQHTVIHLNVEWRDLTVRHWELELDGIPGLAAMRQTPWTRAREIWLRALDLNNGARFRDLPADFLEALISERIAVLADGAHGAVPAGFGTPDGAGLTFGGCPVAGRRADLARYLCGYGNARLRCDRALPDVPRALPHP